MEGEDIFVEQKGPGIRKRHHRERIIKNRMYIAQHLMHPSGDEEPINERWPIEKPNLLNKFNLKCTCPMCKKERYQRGPEKAYQHWQEQNLDIDDWL